VVKKPFLTTLSIFLLKFYLFGENCEAEKKLKKMKGLAFLNRIIDKAGTSARK